MRRTAKKTGMLVTSAITGLAALSQCSAGLLGDLFDKHTDKDRDAIEKRLPACDCTFGYFSTAWQPWGTCDQTVNSGFYNGACSANHPSSVPEFQPGYSVGPSALSLEPQRVIQPESGGVSSEVGSDDAAPILMTPQNANPTDNQNSGAGEIFAPPVGNPLPNEATRELNSSFPGPDLAPDPYGAATPAKQPPNAAQPGRNNSSTAPYPPRKPKQPSLPSSSFNGAATGSESNFRYPVNGLPGTGISLPPRRATSVTIDIPPGSSGTTLSLPDPVNSKAFDGTPVSPPVGLPADSGTNIPLPNSAVPTVQPAPPATQPLNRSQPPVPVPSTLPGPAAALQSPTQQPVSGFRPMQYTNAGVMRSGLYQTASAQPIQSQPAMQHQTSTAFQPATHWQPVPQRPVIQQPPRTNWRVMQGAYQQVPQAPVQSQQRLQTPSERVIMLGPPPRR